MSIVEHKGSRRVVGWEEVVEGDGSSGAIWEGECGVVVCGFEIGDDTIIERCVQIRDDICIL